MNSHESAEYGVVFHRHVSGQRCAIGKNIVRTDYAIVRNVRLSHKQIVIADRSDESASSRAAIHRHTFADDVAFADDQFCIFALKLQVLRRLTKRGEREDLIAFANLAGAGDDYVAMNFDIVMNCDVITYDGVRADLDVCAKLGF